MGAWETIPVFTLIFAGIAGVGGAQAGIQWLFTGERKRPAVDPFDKKLAERDAALKAE